ncbi:unnamed protein product [Coregonus sp. 'balchen']|nr:unnamed protein product [Coregonus sp. 'balchen']
MTLEFRSNKEPFCSTFLATFKQLNDRRQVLLIPVTAYIGLELGFLYGQYTKEYLTCALGIHLVGYVMICFGATSSLFSYVFGHLSQYSGQFTCILALLFGRPHPDQLPVFFVFPALWSMADAVCQTQTNALYGVLFHGQEAAFANYHLWEAVGYVITFACSHFLCVNTKLYILFEVLLLSVTLCFSVEYGEYKSPTPSASSLNPEEGMGVASVSIAYSCIILSSMFLTPSLIRYLGCKLAIFAAMASLIPVSVIIGLGGSHCGLLSEHISSLLATCRQKKSKQKLSSVWGNLMSSLIFGQDTSTFVFCMGKYMYDVFPYIWPRYKHIFSDTQPLSWVCCSGGLTKTSCLCSLCFLLSGAWQMLCGRNKSMQLDIKLYNLAGVLLVAVVLYGWVEFNERRNPTQRKGKTKSKP